MLRFLTLLLCLSFAPLAYGQESGSRCAPLPSIAKQLHERYQEEPAYSGAINGGNLVTLFESPGGKTWTMLAIVHANDSHPTMGCVIIAGEKWTKAK